MTAYISIFTAFFVSYLIRVLPLTLIRKPIENRFIKSFLYYVPYVTLSVMTFPFTSFDSVCTGLPSAPFMLSFTEFPVTPP